MTFLLAKLFQVAKYNVVDSPKTNIYELINYQYIIIIIFINILESNH